MLSLQKKVISTERCVYTVMPHFTVVSVCPIISGRMQDGRELPCLMAQVSYSLERDVIYKLCDIDQKKIYLKDYLFKTISNYYLVNAFIAYDCKQKKQRSRSGSKKKTFPLPYTTEEIYRLTCRYYMITLVCLFFFSLFASQLTLC